MNWREIIGKGLAEELTLPEYRDINRRAHQWNLCYIGEQKTELVERGFCFDGRQTKPIYDELCQLGIDFAECVECANWEAAEEIANQIDALQPPAACAPERGDAGPRDAMDPRFSPAA